MILDAEREFWDAHAAERSGHVPERSESADLDRYSRHLLAAVGPLAGLRVLELGCGGGDLTVGLLDAGASVTALDASPGQVELARRLVAHHRPEADVRFVATSAEETGLPDAAFDVICGKWVLHHLDIPRAVPEIARLLRPNGRAVFYENHDRNPLLAFARRRACGRLGIKRMGTATERPLGKRDISLLRRHFGSVEQSYPEFLCFALLSSRALRYRGYRLLEDLDRLVWERAPSLRPMSWHIVLTCSRPRP